MKWDFKNYFTSFQALKPLFFVALILMGLGLSACGQRGPLIDPEDKKADSSSF